MPVGPDPFIFLLWLCWVGLCAVLLFPVIGAFVHRAALRLRNAIHADAATTDADNATPMPLIAVALFIFFAELVLGCSAVFVYSLLDEAIPETKRIAMSHDTILKNQYLAGLLAVILSCLFFGVGLSVYDKFHRKRIVFNCVYMLLFEIAAAMALAASLNAAYSLLG